MTQATIRVDEFAVYCTHHKQLIDTELHRIISQMLPKRMQTPGFSESLDHAVILGGKRLRPIMAIAVYQLFNDDPSEIMTPACAVELIHAGSLMLDDLPCMDNAELRRGNKTNHSLFGESVTILSSAALWVEAFRIISTVHSDNAAKLITIMARCIGGSGLIQGQLLDLASFNSVQTEQELDECYRLKTSVLFSLAASIGATLGGATEKEQQLLEHFATTFGVAYQIRDDILDATHSLEQTGKDVGIDAKNNKPNYVSVLGVARAKEALGRKVAEGKKQLIALNKDSAILESLINKLLEV